jgi:hypothetical protein
VVSMGHQDCKEGGVGVGWGVCRAMQQNKGQ